MLRTEKEEQLIELIKRQFKNYTEKITLDTRFREDLEGDSLDFVEFVYDVGEEFGVDIPERTTEKIRTVGDALQQIQKYSEAA